MICVARADVGNRRRYFEQLLFRHFQDLVFQVFHDAIEPLQDVISMRSVEIIKGLIVVTRVCELFPAKTS